jgi:hypothetical protein
LASSDRISSLPDAGATGLWFGNCGVIDPEGIMIFLLPYRNASPLPLYFSSALILSWACWTYSLAWGGA